MSVRNGSTTASGTGTSVPSALCTLTTPRTAAVCEDTAEALKASTARATTSEKYFDVDIGSSERYRKRSSRMPVNLEEFELFSSFYCRRAQNIKGTNASEAKPKIQQADRLF